MSAATKDEMALVLAAWERNLLEIKRLIRLRVNPNVCDQVC